jgi:hypothetical protein
MTSRNAEFRDDITGMLTAGGAEGIDREEVLHLEHGRPTSGN